MLPRTFCIVASEVGGCLSRVKGQGCLNGSVRLVAFRI